MRADTLQSSSPRIIVGLVSDAAQQPVAHAAITALKSDGSAIRAALCGANLAASACSGQRGLWYPDLRTRQLMLTGGLLVKF